MYGVPGALMLRAWLRQIAAPILARLLAGGLGGLGLGLVLTGALIGISALIGPALAFGLCGAVCIAAALVLARAPQTAQTPPRPAGPQPVPLAPADPAQSAALQAAFVLGFVTVRALMAKTGTRR